MNEAVASLIDDYIDQHATFAFQEFNVLRVARDQFPDGIGDAAGDDSLTSVKLQYRDLIRDEITAFKNDMQREFRIAFEHAAGDRDDWRDDVLATDPFYPHVDEARREAFAEDLLDYLAEAGESMEPLLRADGDDAWDVVRAVCERDEAEERLASITHHAVSCRRLPIRIGPAPFAHARSPGNERTVIGDSAVPEATV
jgi:hypothetical protein